MSPRASACSRTARESPSIWTIRSRRRPGTGGGPSRRRRMIRSIAAWAPRNRSSRVIGAAGRAHHRSLEPGSDPGPASRRRRGRSGHPTRPAGLVGLGQGQEGLRERAAAGLSEDHGRRHGELPGILERGGRPHEVGPDREGRAGTRQPERRAVVEPDPDHCHQPRRVAGKPGVPRVVRGPGLARDGAAEAERPRRGARAAIDHTAQEVREEIGLLGARRRDPAARLRARPSVGPPAAADRPHAERAHRPAAVRQRRIRRRELERRHLEAPERQGGHGRHPALEADVARRPDDTARVRPPERGGRPPRWMTARAPAGR